MQSARTHTELPVVATATHSRRKDDVPSPRLKLADDDAYDVDAHHPDVPPSDKLGPAACSTSPAGRRYVIITPARDEQKFAETTIASIARQTEAPALWIVVDDGSTDKTPEILKRWQEKLPYLKVLRREDRGSRKLGGGVIDAFYHGYDAIDTSQFDFVVKLDLDLELPAGYFATVMDRMEEDPTLGTFSGKPYFRAPSGKLVSEMCGDENSVGMIKFYRMNAFEQIGGFVREVMWDGIDGHRCRMMGWRAASEDETALRFVHLRPMGTSVRSWRTGRARHGRGQYFMGTSVSYMLASAIYRMTRPPRLIGGLAMLYGYFGAMFDRLPRYEEQFDDARFGSFVRRYQSMCLLYGKRRATERIEEEAAAVSARES